MDINTFVIKIAEQYDDSDISLFAPKTKYKELDEWSSIMALSIIAMIDDNFHIRLKGNDIRNTSTIEELFLVVIEKYR